MSRPTAPPEATAREPPTDVMLYVCDALSTIKHGEIVIVVHDGHVVRIEKKDKVLIK